MNPSDNGMPRRHIDTMLTHAGGSPRERHGAVNPPVYRASTILFPTVAEWEASREHARRFDVIRYGQLGTPTTFALEEAVAQLEGGYRTALVPSGLAAATVTLLALLENGDHLLMVDTTYAPTRRFCDAVLSRFGVATTYYDPLVGDTIREQIQPNTRVVFLENPGSLTFEVQDLPAIAEAARESGVIVIMDNSWAGPYFYPALSLGADVSVLAATKYLAGHADVMLGTITCTERLYERIRSAVAELGLCVSPDDAYLVLRGMRTMGVRLARHHDSGIRVAKWLAARPEVTRVLHPALTGDSGHAIWQRDFRGASGLFGVELATSSKAAADAMLNSLQLFGIGASFGGFESLAIPVDPTPFRTATSWAGRGRLLRLHVGLEDPEDLIADLERGLEALNAVNQSQEQLA